jgi:uncharacterized protein
MAKIDLLVQDFLAQKTIAVVGVSNTRETGCNLTYKKLKENGYRVFPVNPHLPTYNDDPCFPDLMALPEKPDAVFVLANPKVTEMIVNQCVGLGIKRVWMHCMMGTKPGLAAGMTSVSLEAIQLCNENGIKVIPGSCPNQFLRPDIGHGLMRKMWRLFGFLKIE